MTPATTPRHIDAGNDAGNDAGYFPRAPPAASEWTIEGLLNERRVASVG